MGTYSYILIEDELSLYHTRISSWSPMITRISVSGNCGLYGVPNQAIIGDAFVAAPTKSSLTSIADQFSTTTREINKALIRCEVSSKALIRAILFFSMVVGWWSISVVGWVNAPDKESSISRINGQNMDICGGPSKPIHYTSFSATSTRVYFSEQCCLKF